MASVGKRVVFVSQKSDGRSALSIGMDWSARITTIGLEFALPACLGFGLDRWWATSPWLTVIGAFLGLGIGMMHVIRLGSSLPGPSVGTRGGRLDQDRGQRTR
jgi:F0F1-type ATP synthase assembly protein I